MQLVVIAVYRPYFNHQKDPDATAFDAELRKVVLGFPKNWPVLLAGDLNGQLGRNITSSSKSESDWERMPQCSQ